METGVTGSLPASDAIAAFRRFNRLYTRFIGTLQEGLLETPYSLSEARVLMSWPRAGGHSPERLCKSLAWMRDI